MKILESFVEKGFKFYLLKVIRTFLNENFILQFIKEQPDNKLSKKIKMKDLDI